MTAHRFGGRWTRQKLDALRDYVGFFVTAMQGQRFKLVYIDTFAGTGKCAIRVPGGESTIDGSASIALNACRPFDEYFFVEARTKHVAQLKALASFRWLNFQYNVTILTTTT